MANKFHYITIKLLPDEKSQIPERFDRESVFFQFAPHLAASRIVCPLSDKLKKDENLGHMWHDMEPVEGKYSFELATELPYYLPDLNGRAEYILTLDEGHCYVCNRMMRAFFGKGYPETEGDDYLLIHRMALPSLVKDPKYKGLHLSPMKTFIGRRFDVEATCAEEALEDNFIKWRSILLDDIRNITNGFRIVAPPKARHLFPYPAIASYPVFWLAAKGKDNKLGFEQITGDAAAVAFRSLNNIKQGEVNELGKVLTKLEKPAAHHSGIGIAIAYCHYGHYDQALIQICTALETQLSEFLKLHLEQKGFAQK